MPTSFDTSFGSGDLIEASHVQQYVTPINALETGAAVYAADSGTTDDYAVTMSPAPTAYTEGMFLHFKANTANTGAATLNVNGLGAKPITQNGGTTLRTGSIVAGQIVTVVYDGTQFQLVGGGALAASDMPSGIDAAKIADGSVSNTEFECLNGVTSSLQAQIDAKPDALTDLSDVNAPSPGDGQVLTWDNGSSKWVPADVVTELAHLTDVSVPSPGAGDVLTWNATDSKWEAGAPTSFTSLAVPITPVLYFSGIVKYNTSTLTSTPLPVDGSGDLDLDVETDIVYLATADTFCRNLTLESGAYLTPMGYRIQATGTITIEGTLDMSATTLSTYVPTGPLPAGGSSPTGFFIGGQGGDGGDGDGTSGQAVGPDFFTSALLSNPTTYFPNYPADGFSFSGQAGGTGGMGAIGTAVPGSGGPGGGTILLIAPHILGSGALDVSGYPGGDASGNTTGDEAGGGGGGGGGAIVLISPDIGGSLSYVLSGGSGGSGHSAGANGQAGTLYTLS